MGNSTQQETPMRYVQNLDKLPAKELESKRSRFVKVFALGGNRFQAVTYTEPVHKMNRETGKWEEIDAAFYPDGQEDRLKTVSDTYTASCGVSGKAPFVTVSDTEGHQISWGLEDAHEVKPKAAERPAPAPASNVRELRESVLERQRHHITYEGIYPGVNMICQSGGRFKDTFEFNAPEAVRPIIYRFAAPGLRFEKLEGEQVAVMNEKGEKVFLFPAPYLQDAKGECGTVTVQLDGNAEECRLICQPDEAFMASAAYPVRLDPEVRTAQDSSGIEDLYVREGYHTSFTNSELWITNNTYYGNRVS